MSMSRITQFQDFMLERGLNGDDAKARGIIREEFTASESELSEFFGHGPLEELFANQDITEILVNGPAQIWAEKSGRLELQQNKFSCEDALKRYVRKILAAKGRKVDQRAPFVDCVMEDGSRVHVAIPPSSKNGICLSIRKFRKEGWKLVDLLGSQMFSVECFEYLQKSILAKKNIFVCGGTGSGKTSLLGALIGEVSPFERIIALEDISEIKTNHPHFISLEARPENLEGEGEVTIKKLLKESLRMRPDRIVVGECRGVEALDLSLALNTGHRGSMATIHANSPRDALCRLETLALLAAENLSERAVKQMIGASVDIVIHLERAKGRKISSIAEIKGVDQGNYLLKEVKI